MQGICYLGTSMHKRQKYNANVITACIIYYTVSSSITLYSGPSYNGLSK